MTRRLCAVAFAAVLVLALASGTASAQMLRYSNHREVQIPDYALLRIGPFYSSLAFSQSVGYRYSRSRGAGTGYLTDNRLGAITEDGSEYPMISVLTMRNYLLISRRADLDLSVSASYAYYPRGTQESGWQIFLPEEGVSAGLSSEFMLTPFVRGTLFDNILYRTDFVDTQGLSDYYGGEEYVYFNNVAGVNLDWLMAKDQNMALGVSREDMIPRDKEFEDQERVSYTESALYQFQVFSGLVMGAGAEFIQHRYASTGRVDVSQQNYFVNLGFAKDIEGGFRLTRATTGSIRLGYSRAAAASRSKVSDETGADTAASARPQAESLAVGVRLETAVAKEVTQTITFGRGLRNGFQAPIEQYEQWQYRLEWRRLEALAALWTGLSTVEPEGSLASRYDDWSSGVTFRVPIVRGVVVVATSTYADRINDNDRLEGLPPESAFDYATWTSTIGVGLPVTRHIAFSADASHIERISDDERLAYTRDVVAATLTYSKQF